MIDAQNLFWDSCVFIRYLTGQPFEHVDDIERLIEDARQKKRKIYSSTICLTEIRPRFLKAKGFGTAAELFEELGSSFELIDPNPNILLAAGELRDAEPVNPSDAKAPPRVIGTADAVHLMTCLYLRDVLAVTDIVFDTFDEGKGKSWEGKCIPLIGFEN